MFSDDELERYARHLVMHDVGGAGQQKLKAARVAIVGAGGLGAPVVLYLAAAGVGRLRLIDDDHVSLSNLQRQIIFKTTDAQAGRRKVEAASDAVGALNPHVMVEAHPSRLEADNARELLDGVDVVVDGSDSFKTRDLVARHCEAARIPLISGAVELFDGSVTVLMPYEANQNGFLNPRFQDLFPAAPPDHAIPVCEEVGIIGALTGVIGTLQAMEAIKLITGIGQPLIGRLMMYDARAAVFETITYRRRGA